MYLLSYATIENAGLSRLAAQHLEDRTDKAIFKVILKLCCFFGVPYCYPAQRTILLYLRLWERINISLRTLNYRLKKLEALGILKRQRRHRRGKQGDFQPHTTLYKLAGPLAALFYIIKRTGQKVGAFFRLQWIANNPIPRERSSYDGHGLSNGERTTKDLKGGPRGNISSESPPRWDLERLRQIIKALP